MKIAIDISPLESGHKIRGVGFYLSYLKTALLTHFPENKYYFFKKGDAIDSSVDIVHYPYFDPFFLTLPFRLQHKTVVTVHDLTPVVFPQHFPAGVKGLLKWQLQRFNLQKVDGIITDSKASKKDIERLVGIAPDKVSVAYLAAGDEFKKIHDNSLLGKVKKRYNLPENFVLYVGDVTWNKNVPRLVRVVSKLDIPLIMIGKSLASKDFDKNNPWNKDLMEVQHLAEKNSNIILLGFVPTEDLVVLYNLAKVFVFPSVYEGFGLPIVEAMQSGCPVVISKESCMPEVGGDAVVYFNGYEDDSLEEAIQRVLKSDNLQKELSEKGLEQAKKFSWQKTAEQTISAYENALSS